MKIFESRIQRKEDKTASDNFLRNVPFDKVIEQYPRGIYNFRPYRIPIVDPLTVDWNTKLDIDGSMLYRWATPVPILEIWATWKKIKYVLAFSDKNYENKEWLKQFLWILGKYVLNDNRYLLSISPIVTVYDSTSYKVFKSYYLFKKKIWSKYIGMEYRETWILNCLISDRIEF